MTVGDVFKVVGGGTPSTAEARFWGGDIPWATSADLDDDLNIRPRKAITESAVAASAVNVVPPGSIVVATRVGLGKVGIARTRLAFSQDSQGLISNGKDINPKFAALQLKLRVQEFRHISRGTTIAGVTKKQLLDVPFDLPDRSEQDRTVEHLESQFSKIDAGTASLRAAQAKLRRYRASVLKAACEGRLVPTEAELARQEGRDYETGEQLLARVRTLAKPNTSAAPSTSSPNTDLPEGWAWAIVADIAQVTGGLTKNPSREKLPYKLPYLRVANVYANELRLDEIEHIGVANSEIQRVLLKKGDLLVVEGNGSADQIGRLAMWDGSIDPCAHQNHLIKIRHHETCNPSWMMVYFLSTHGRNAIGQSASSTSGLHTLSIGKVSSLAIRLPPVQEQERIAAEVELRLAFVDRLAADIDASFHRTARLRNATLSAALTTGSGRVSGNKG